MTWIWCGAKFATNTIIWLNSITYDHDSSPDFVTNDYNMGLYSDDYEMMMIFSPSSLNKWLFRVDKMIFVWQESVIAINSSPFLRHNDECLFSVLFCGFQYHFEIGVTGRFFFLAKAIRYILLFAKPFDDINITRKYYKIIVSFLLYIVWLFHL